MSVKLKIKKLHEDAVIPKYATDGSGCFDLCAVGIGGYTISEHETLEKAGYNHANEIVMPGHSTSLRTGLAFEVPSGHVMLIFSRSGHGFNLDTRLSNCVGVIDSDYRGEVKVKLRNDGGNMRLPLRVQPGDRIAQAMLVPIPRVELEEVDELSGTERGEGGFGSTGA